MSRRATILGLSETAEALLADPATPAARTIAARVVRDVAAAVAAAERASAADHDDRAPREADVARILGCDVSTLRRWRTARRPAQ